MKQGDNRKVLPSKVRPECHKCKNKGFGNVYGRLSWNQISPTITSGCTSLSMGRFGHPSQIRTISIREAAMIQTFPKSYVLKTNFMTTARKLVGNALPPMFAKIIAEKCLTAFNDIKGA